MVAARFNRLVPGSKFPFNLLDDIYLPQTAVDMIPSASIQERYADGQDALAATGMNQIWHRSGFGKQFKTRGRVPEAMSAKT